MINDSITKAERRNMESLISVIIPIYNMEAFLARCLDSVLNNSYQNLEVICVDDGSTDRSPEILRDYAEKDSRIVPIFQANGGVSSARNAALDRMTGEYVTFIDSDDYVHPQYFELLLRALELSGAEVSIGGIERTDGACDPSSAARFSLSENDIRLLTLSNYNKAIRPTSYCCCKLFRSTLIGNTRFQKDVSFAEDTLFLLKLWEKHPSVRFALFNHAVYYYYQGRGDSLANLGRDKGAVPFISYLAQQAAAEGKEAVYLEPAVRRGLYYRYYFTYLKKDRRHVRELGVILRRRIGQLWRSGLFSVKDKFFWTLFIFSPRLDHLHRLFRDPSLKQTERKQREAIEKRSTA